MSWITTIPYSDADSHLKRLYDRVKGPNNNIDNVLAVHSLRPHTLTGHMTLYKSVLHHSQNILPKWYLEALGVYVSRLNNCNYCVEHHWHGLKRLWQDDAKSEAFLRSVNLNEVDDFLGDRFDMGMIYARKLTLDIQQINKKDYERLKEVGFDDGEVLEINQVVSYFNYVNRSVLGLGVSIKGDILGLSPGESDQPDNWSHH